MRTLIFSVPFSFPVLFFAADFPTVHNGHNDRVTRPFIRELGLASRTAGSDHHHFIQTCTVGSDRKYAAVHQLGSKKKNIPARPYFPFQGKRLTAAGDKALTRAIRSYLKARGLE